MPIYKKEPSITPGNLVIREGLSVEGNLPSYNNLIAFLANYETDIGAYIDAYAPNFTFDPNATWDSGTPPVLYDIVYLNADGTYHKAIVNEGAQTENVAGMRWLTSEHANIVIGQGFLGMGTATTAGTLGYLVTNDGIDVGDDVYLSTSTAGLLQSTISDVHLGYYAGIDGSSNYVLALTVGESFFRRDTYDNLTNKGMDADLNTHRNLAYGPCYYFNGVDATISFADDPNINFSTTDFTVVVSFQTGADYSGTAGTLINKGTGPERYDIEIGTDDKVHFIIQDDSTTADVVSDDVLNDDVVHIVACCVDRDGNATMWVDGELQADTAAAPTNTLTDTDVLYFGSNGGSSQWYDGLIYHVRYFNRLLSALDAQPWSRNPFKQAEYADYGANQADIVSGDLIIGKRYRIDVYGSGDFLNVGAGSNAVDVEFVAILATPTSWSGDTLHQIGETFSIIPENMSLETAFDGTPNETNSLAVTSLEVLNPRTQIALDSVTIERGGNASFGNYPLEPWHADWTAIEIGGNGAITGLQAQTASNEFWFAQNAYYDGDWNYMDTDQASAIQLIDGTIVFKTVVSGTEDTTITWVDSVTIAVDGAITLVNATDSTTEDTGSIITDGGIGVAGSIVSGGSIYPNAADNGTIGTATNEWNSAYFGAAGVFIGLGQEVHIYESSGATYYDVAGDNVFYLRSNAEGSAENMIVATGGGSVALYHHNTLRLQTTATGLEVTDTIDTDLVIEESTESGTGDAGRLTFRSQNDTPAALDFADIRLNKIVDTTDSEEARLDFYLEDGSGSSVNIFQVDGTANRIYVPQATAASSTVTGAIVTTGGLGVSLAAWIGGLLNVNSTGTFTGNVDVPSLDVDGDITMQDGSTNDKYTIGYNSTDESLDFTYVG